MLAGFHEKFIPIYLHSNQVRKPTGKPVARLFLKRCIVTLRMYQPCFAVYIDLGPMNRHRSASVKVEIMRIFKNPLRILILLIFANAMSIWKTSSAQDMSITTSKDGSCEKVVHFSVEMTQRSSVTELQSRIHAHEGTKLALNKEPRPGANWREGNPFWEEVYEFYYPEIYRHIKDSEEHEARHQKLMLPGQLDPEVCKKHWALLNSKHGAVASRIRQTLGFKNLLERLEKNSLPQKRLQHWADKAHQEINEGMKIFDDEEFRSNQAQYRKSHQELLEYDNHFVENLKKIDSSYGAEEKKKSIEIGYQISMRNKDKLIDIVRRFKASEKLAP